MKINILPASVNDKPILQRMMELYQYDFSEFQNNDLDAQGCFGYPFLDYYWSEEGRYPFLVQVDDKLVGFVLVNHHIYILGNEWSIAEFFILRKYRRTGIGKRVAFYIFDQFQGKWEIQETKANLPAQRFWQKVITEYTEGQYQEACLNNEQ